MQTMDYHEFQQKIITEMASEENHNDANLSFIPLSSEELRVQKE